MGLLNVVSNSQMVAQETADAAAKAALDQQATPVVLNLAAHVRRCFEDAKTARQQHENDMLASLRARNGEYDPDILSEIKSLGGSEVYSRVTATKMRGAQSWLKDIYLNIERPFTLDPTPLPTLEQDIEPAVQQMVESIGLQAAMAGVPPSAQDMQELHEKIADKARADALQAARDRADRAADKVDDILVEGGFYKALEEALTDITTFKVCCIKGPVVRIKKRLKWVDQPAVPADPANPAAAAAPAKRVPVVVSEPIYTFSRVSPLALYPARNAAKIGDGFVIQRHKLFRSDLAELLGTPGFDDKAIRDVLDLYGRGGLNEWLSVDTQEAAANNSGTFAGTTTASPTIDALEYWGSVQGSMLLEWGMDPTMVPDPQIDYPCNVWVIGAYVIKAMLNADPLARVPFSVSSLVKIPGTIWGEGLHEQLRDVQQVCNASMRSLVNNMAIASGPMVGIDAGRLPAGEKITSLRPWKIFQFIRDQFGGSQQKPIEFFQPQSNAAELHGVFEKFSVLADEYSNIPRYMLGDNAVGGAGRTAAGLSMLMNAANKGIKNVANNIDTDIIVPTVERLYYYLMLNDPDEDLKGDLQIVARGASGLMLKELLNQRRIEFLREVPVLQQMGVVKPEGVAALLREIVKGLEMPQDTIIPSDEEIRQMQAAMALQQQMQADAAAAESEQYTMQHDESGRMTGMTVKGSRPKPKEPQAQDQQLRSLSTGPKPH